MKITDEKVEIINKNKLKHMGKREGLGTHLETSGGTTEVLLNRAILCDVTDLGNLINELTAIKELLEEECGLIV